MQHSYITYYCLSELDTNNAMRFYTKDGLIGQRILTKECLYESRDEAEKTLQYMQENLCNTDNINIQPVRLVPDDTGEEFDESVE